MKNTWKVLIGLEMARHGESWEDVEANTMTEEEMNKVFDFYSHGGTKGCSFTVWTRARVYFPVSYDGAESVGSVSRHPDGKPTPHLSGD